MPLSTYRKKAKKLLSFLRELQEDDHPVTAPCLLSAKHALRYSSRCAFVEVLDDTNGWSPSDVDRDLLSAFIVSQLEAQKLTRHGSEKVLVSPILAFVFDSLPSRFESSEAYPTLFSWYSRPSHRSYLAFAYIDLDMESRIYTIKELLDLRRSTAPRVAREMAGKMLDLAMIVDGAAESKLPTGRQKERSSDSSEEVIYKGNLKRRAAREARRESHREQHREHIRDHRLEKSSDAQSAVREEPKTVVKEPSNEAQPAQADIRKPQPPPQGPARQGTSSESNQRLEWKYRGRSDSEVVATQPLPAPTGGLAQKNEGFQRFYKAVVSPTHVRVTAGGRIVPNNRGPPSPISKRPKDEITADDQSAHEGPNSAKATANPVGMPMGQAMPALMPQLPLGFRPGQPMYPGFPIFPMAFGQQFPPGFAYPPGMGPAQLSENSKTAESQDNKTSGQGDGSDKIKVSPPEQFDSTKPFWLNGQFLYPFPGAGLPPHMANPFMPYPMFGMPPGFGPQFASPVMPPPGGLGYPPMGSFPPQNSPAPQNSAIPPVVNSNVPHEVPAQTPLAPHPSSIRPSEISKKQIASFKKDLKYLEDQLQYNRHQIDEKEIVSKIEVTKGHIERFETKLQTQLEYERATYPKAENDMEIQNEDVAPGVKAVQTSRPPSEATNAEGIAKGKVSQAATRRSSRSRAHPGVTGESGRVNYNFSPERPTSLKYPETGRTTNLNLPSEAALAPVFQPRARCDSSEDSDRLIVSSTLSQQRPVVSRNETNASVRMEMPRTSRKEGTSVSNASTLSDTQSSANSGQTDRKYVVPYLLGTLPQGVDPRTARPDDYTYVRPLTNDEIRARQLYWGKAPKTICQGLPKYDGRHFYPASPVKQQTASSSSGFTLSVPMGELDTLFHRADTDPFHTGPPVHRPVATHVSDPGFECAALRHTSSYLTQVAPDSGTSAQYDSEDDVPMVHSALASCSNQADSRSINSSDRRAEKASNRLLQTMVKKGATSSAVSSATAQGFLPQYKAFAAASLGPSLNNKMTAQAMRDTSPSKMSVSDVNDLSDGGAMLSPIADKRGENRPPKMALDDHFQGVSVRGK